MSQNLFERSTQFQKNTMQVRLLMFSRIIKFRLLKNHNRVNVIDEIIEMFAGLRKLLLS